MSPLVTSRRTWQPTYRCGVPGCYQRSMPVVAYGERHERARHARCACGWVGVRYGQHVAQRRRYGHETAACRLVAYQRLKGPSVRFGTLLVPLGGE